MLSNNNERLKIWLSCKDPFDYDEFCAAATAKRVQIMTAFAFADKIGIILCAKAQFPDMNHAEAAVAFLDKYKNQVVVIPLPAMLGQEIGQMPSITIKQGCCGGGKVR